MAQMNFQTQNEPFRQLIGNGMSFVVPRFQRDYSWDDTQWDDLWIDILETVREGGEPAHYMGYLVLQSTGEQSRNVIDGQQRLTTLSLIILAGLKHLKRLSDEGVDPADNLIRFEQIRNTYVGYLDPVTLNVRPKLTLNRHNNNYFQTYIVTLPDVLPSRRFNTSEMLMRKAFEWFDKRFADYLKTVGDKGMAIAQFIDRLSMRLFFTVITVTDELNAYRVFETLNARGVRLSSTDLLKNYLFSVLSRDSVHEQELDRLDERWAQIVDRLGSERFPAYLRVHWNSRHPGRVREVDLFKIVRNSIRDAKSVFRLLSEIDEDLETYLMLTAGLTQGLDPAAARAIDELKLFRVKQPESMLLTARRMLNEQDFIRVLKAIVVVSFRYNIIGSMATGDQETLYGQIVRRLLEGTIHNASELILALRPVYPSDELFQEAFAAKSMKTTQGGNRKLVRYTLSSIERHVGGQEIDLVSERFTVEHVLPEHPGAGWEHVDDADLDALIYRLGNMTLLETSANCDIGNAPFNAKREVYASSSIVITRRIAEHSGPWDWAAIDHRQDWLAQQAAAAWRLTQLSDGPHS
jgi:hypothetical protein